MDTPQQNSAFRDPSDPPPRKLNLREPQPPPPEVLPPPPDVYEILEQNKAHEAGLRINGTVPEHRAHTRRIRHWMWGLLSFDGVMIILIVLSRNPAVYFFGGCGIVLFSCAYTWFMLKVMDNY